MIGVRVQVAGATVGTGPNKDRVFVSTSGDWEPAGDVAASLVRVSDLEYERRTASERKPKQKGVRT